MKINKIFIASVSLFANMLASNVSASELPNLPEAVANNAVTKVTTESGDYFISFMGLAEGKTHHDVHNKVWALKIGDDAWKEKAPVPGSLELKGRLASIATSLNGKAYLFGGYTVAEDHTEISSPDVFSYDVEEDKYTLLSPMPVPVDDSIAIPYLERYIYLVSGWHNDGNVNLVQMYDTKTDKWSQASPFLGEPVFGQAGGIAGNTIVICDGVKVVPQKMKRRTFKAAKQCRKGIVDAKNPNKIDWRFIAHPTGKSRYRMASVGYESNEGNYVIFTGGSSNPYNYNGVGYNGTPSQPSNAFWLYNIDKKSWKYLTNKAPRTMDHRGLLIHNDQFFTVGGMGEKQKVLKEVISRKIKL